MANEQQATIKEVARLAGVAASSVSRALNGHPDVSQEMRLRVLEAVEQLGYQPDFLAQSLRLGASRTIGFVVRDIANSLFAGIVKGAEQELEANGYSTLLMNSLGDPRLDARHVRVLRQRRVDGLILSLQSETNEDTVRALTEVAATPLVLLDREVEGVACDAVFFDHATGVSEATSALLRLGHRRIGIIVGTSETRGSRERVLGYRKAYAAAGVPVDERDVMDSGTYSQDWGFEAASRFVSGAQRPTALIAGNGQIGIGVLAALNEQGKRYGEQISLVVCDDLELLRLMDPPVSVVARDAERMGTAAAQLLLKRLQDEESPLRQVVLPTIYVPRGSSQRPWLESKRPRTVRSRR